MIAIGKINSLTLVKQLGAESYLGDEHSVKIRLADPALTVKNIALGDTVQAFVYVDADGHLAATLHLPWAEVEDIAWLSVVSVNYTGAFLDWGLYKNLLVPFSEQHHEMEVGQHYLVKLFLDDKNRMVASTKINRYLQETSDEFTAGQEVTIVIADNTDLGVKVIINHAYWGMLYRNEIFQPVQMGQKITAYIKRLREDHKLDVSLQPQGYSKVITLTEQIMAQLHAHQGVLPFSDKSPAEEIYATFGVSKKVFKQALGALYKEQKILLENRQLTLKSL